MGLLIFGTGGAGGSSTDLSGDTVTPQQVRNPYTFHDANGDPQTGEIYNWDGTLLSGSSSDVNKMQVSASTNTRYLKAGSYLNRDIELLGMPSGSATMSRSDNVITLTKTAGYIAAGTATETIPTYAGGTVTPGKNSQTVDITGKYATGNVVVSGDPNLVAGNIKSGASIFGVIGTYTGQSYSTYTGATSVTPSSSNQTLSTGGKIVNSNIVVYGDSGLRADRIRSGYSIFGVTGTYTGDLYFQTTSVTPGTTSMSVACSGYPYMFGFVGNTTVTDKIASGMGRRGSTTGRAYVVDRGAGNVLDISWNSSYFTVSVKSSYSYTFNTGISYDIWIAYM